MDKTGEATAFAVDKHHMVTNAHVCDGQTELTAEDVDGKQIKVKVTEIDQQHDLCLLTTRANLKPLKITRDRLRITTKVLTFGNADGMYPVLLEGYLGKTDDVLGIKCRLISNMTFPGSSGSPVINEKNEVVGIVFACDMQTHFGFMVQAADILDFLKTCGVKN